MKPEWNNLNEIWPPPETLVLCLVNYEFAVMQLIYTYDYHLEPVKPIWIDADHDCEVNMSDVSHWMELPELPLIIRGD